MNKIKIVLEYYAKKFWHMIIEFFKMILAGCAIFFVGVVVPVFIGQKICMWFGETADPSTLLALWVIILWAMIILYLLIDSIIKGFKKDIVILRKKFKEEEI